MKKVYAILIVDYHNNEITKLHDNAFLTKEAAHAEAKKLADKYIKSRMKKNRKDHLKYNDGACMIYCGPSDNCLFAEVQYKIQEVIMKE